MAATKLQFQKATKRTARARVALIGPAGSGKTYTSLAIATQLGKRVALIDTEHGSASKYAGIFEFDVLEPPDYAPATYVQAIEAAEEAGFDVVVIDSLSHAWMGRGGALEQVDNAAKKSRSGNSFNAWREITPQHNALVEAMLACKAHLFVTMRTKTEYVIEENEQGKKAPRKIGLAPVQRDGLEYEFDVTADLDLDNHLVVGKTRCPALKGRIFHQAGADVAGLLTEWLTDGAPPALSAIEEFFGAFRGCSSLAEADDIIARIAQRKAEFSEPELARIRSLAKRTREKFVASTDTANGGAS
jgi:hypothetical protein